MTHVASIPEAPPLTNGLTVGHTPPIGFGFSSPISNEFVKQRRVRVSDSGQRLCEEEEEESVCVFILDVNINVRFCMYVPLVVDEITEVTLDSVCFSLVMN
ncbi:hypothetical protein HanIR_Chr14g0692131 [Helianthus annuus]|nr:hypothetical protein HanIR_Chr14g0692131 [Helianthus annuus]